VRGGAEGRRKENYKAAQKQAALGTRREVCDYGQARKKRLKRGLEKKEAWREYDFM
jgi:hypothetical protein